MARAAKSGGSAYQAINTSNISRLLPCSGYWYWFR